MAERELWYATGGPLLYDDEEIATGWYPSPYDLLAMRAALFSQAYCTDAPVNDLELARRMDIDGTVGTILKAGADGLPADSVITEDATYVTIGGRILSSAAMRLTTTPAAGSIIQGDADGDFAWVSLALIETDPVWTAWIATVRAVNTVFGGPATGASATPTFRSLVIADIPAGIDHGGLAGLTDDDHPQYLHLDKAAQSILQTPIFNYLTASLPVVTDASKYLVSLAYTGVTSLRKNLGLETSDSPTFTGLTVGALAGVLKATAGVISGSAVHADLGSIGENDHHTKFTTTEHSAIGDGAPHHAAITLDVNAETLLSLSTQALGLDTQTANYVFAGPASGAVAAPTFRAMVSADVSGITTVDRGDPTDYDVTSFTSDGSWYDLDLSALVPAGAKFIILRMDAASTVAGDYIHFREKGNTSYFNTAVCAIGTANVVCRMGWPIVACDADRVIQYSIGKSGTWTSYGLIVRGWIF